MSQRTGLLIAVLLTAFVLVVGGAIAGRTTQPKKTPVEAAAVQQQAVQQLMERETAYQDLARQANERLQQAYAKLQARATSPAFVFSPEQVANIALQMAPGAVLLSIPELVDFQGVMAYKVMLSTGIVYLDANSGQVLFNGIVTPVSVGSSYKGSSKTGGSGDHGGGGNGESEGGGESDGGGGQPGEGGD
jgi:uncharacterized membrane protein YgcG